MNIKRAIFTGILLWVLIFFEVSILMFGLGLEGTIYYVLHYILLIILVLISALIYFKDKKIEVNATEGLLLGLVFIVVGLILDAVITIPLFIKDYNFFFEWTLWLGLLETLVITTIVGALKK